MQNTNSSEQLDAVFTKWAIGLLLDGSAYSADYINVQTIKFAQDYSYVPDWQSIATASDEEERSQYLSEEADAALNFLNDLAVPPYCSFYFEDNSLFLMPNVESVQEDVGFTSSRDADYPADDYEGEWLHVSDHGNVTLYVRHDGEDTEVWGLV